MDTKTKPVLETLTKLRSVAITKSMPVHKYSQWKEHITVLEDLAMDCFSSKSHSATSTRSTVINDPTEVHSSTTITYHSDVISNTSTDEEMHNEDVHVTTFRPVDESEKNSQLERHQEDTTLDCQDRLDAHDKLHAPQD